MLKQPVREPTWYAKANSNHVKLAGRASSKLHTARAPVLRDVFLRLHRDGVRSSRRSDHVHVADRSADQITLTAQVHLVGVLDRHGCEDDNAVVRTLSGRECDRLRGQCLEGIVVSPRLEVTFHRGGDFALTELDEDSAAASVLHTELRLRIVLDLELEGV